MLAVTDQSNYLGRFAGLVAVLTVRVFAGILIGADLAADSGGRKWPRKERDSHAAPQLLGSGLVLSNLAVG